MPPAGLLHRISELLERSGLMIQRDKLEVGDPISDDDAEKLVTLDRLGARLCLFSIEPDQDDGFLAFGLYSIVDPSDVVAAIKFEFEDAGGVTISDVGVWPEMPDLFKNLSDAGFRDDQNCDADIAYKVIEIIVEEFVSMPTD